MQSVTITQDSKKALCHPEKSTPKDLQVLYMRSTASYLTHVPCSVLGGTRYYLKSVSESPVEKTLRLMRCMIHCVLQDSMRLPTCHEPDASRL